MALEYIVAGRRPLPKGPTPWVWELEMADGQADDAFIDAFDEGSFELCEIERTGNDEFFAWVEKYTGFPPASVVTIRPAAWEFSRAAAEILAAALDGVSFVDGLVEEEGLEAGCGPAPAARSLNELQQRVQAAADAPEAICARWEAQELKRQQEADRRDPEAVVLRKKENDWSDV